MQPLSSRALEMLAQLFSASSNLQLPVGLAEQIIEVRQWAQAQVNNLPKQAENSATPAVRSKERLVA